jgi:hypothetical protein
MLKTRIMRVLLFVLLLGMIGTSFGSGWFILRELSGSGHMALGNSTIQTPTVWDYPTRAEQQSTYNFGGLFYSHGHAHPNRTKL